MNHVDNKILDVIGWIASSLDAVVTGVTNAQGTILIEYGKRIKRKLQENGRRISRITKSLGLLSEQQLHSAGISGSVLESVILTPAEEIDSIESGLLPTTPISDDPVNCTPLGNCLEACQDPATGEVVIQTIPGCIVPEPPQPPLPPVTDPPSTGSISFPSYSGPPQCWTNGQISNYVGSNPPGTWLTQPATWFSGKGVGVVGEIFVRNSICMTPFLTSLVGSYVDLYQNAYTGRMTNQFNVDAYSTGLHKRNLIITQETQRTSTNYLSTDDPDYAAIFRTRFGLQNPLGEASSPGYTHNEFLRDLASSSNIEGEGGSILVSSDFDNTLTDLLV